MEDAMIVFFITIISGTCAQTFSLGNCDPSLVTIKNFDKIKWSGKWYEIKRGFNLREVGKKCHIFNHNLSTGNHIYEVENTFVFEGQGNQMQSLLIDVDADDLDRGKLKVTPGIISEQQPLWVLDSDYENYLVLYSCLDAYKGKLEWAWIHSLKLNPDDEYIAKGEKVLKDRNINVELFKENRSC